MADNYLEKKMEEYRSGRCSSSSYRRPASARGTIPGELVTEFPPSPLHISGLLEPGAARPSATMAALTKLLVEAGFNVTFSAPGADIHRCSSLGRTLGARFLPDGLDPPADAILLTADSRGARISCGRRSICVETSAGAGSPDAGGEPDGTLIKSVAWSAAMLANFNRFGKNMLTNIKITGVSF